MVKAKELYHHAEKTTRDPYNKVIQYIESLSDKLIEVAKQGKYSYYIPVDDLDAIVGDIGSDNDRLRKTIIIALNDDMFKVEGYPITISWDINKDSNLRRQE